MKTNSFISVIVCTYNRCESLRDTLNSLLQQEHNGCFDFEIIVVDNNSKDKTREAVEAYILKHNGRLKYTFEPNQGLSYARNRGIKEAKGEIIAFTDDDCLPERKWLLKIWQKFEESKILDGVLGGSIWEDGKRFYSQNNILRGNGLNMSFRKQVFDDMVAFDIHFGVGSIGCSTDDKEFIYRAMRKNKNIIICDEILVTHKHRINYKEELRIAYRDCKGYIILLLKYVFKDRDFFALKKIYWCISTGLLELFSEMRKKNKKRIKLKIVQLFGIFVGLIKGFYVWLILEPINSLCQR